MAEIMAWIGSRLQAVPKSVEGAAKCLAGKAYISMMAMFGCGPGGGIYDGRDKAFSYLERVPI